VVAPGPAPPAPRRRLSPGCPPRPARQTEPNRAQQTAVALLSSSDSPRCAPFLPRRCRHLGREIRRCPAPAAQPAPFIDRERGTGESPRSGAHEPSARNVDRYRDGRPPPLRGDHVACGRRLASVPPRYTRRERDSSATMSVDAPLVRRGSSTAASGGAAREPRGLPAGSREQDTRAAPRRRKPQFATRHSRA